MWNSFRIVRGVDGSRDWGTVRPATRRCRPLGLPDSESSRDQLVHLEIGARLAGAGVY
jgi:hypothetical protein